MHLFVLQENSDKSVIELQQYAKKNKPNLHILNKLQEEMKKLASQRVSVVPTKCFRQRDTIYIYFFILFDTRRKQGRNPK